MYYIYTINRFLTERTVHQYNYQSIARAARGLVAQADKRYGPSGWQMIHDDTLVGFYARAENGECMVIRPSRNI